MASKLNDADVAAIRKTSQKYQDCARVGDWDTWMQLSEDDAVFMPPNSETLDTRAKVRAFVDNFPKMTEFKLTILEVDGRDDMAFVRGRYELIAGGVPDRGKYIELWRRQSDGSWKIFRDIWNTDLSK